MNTQEYIETLRDALKIGYSYAEDVGLISDVLCQPHTKGYVDHMEAMRKALALPVPTVRVEEVARAITREIKHQDSSGYLDCDSLGNVTIDCCEINMSLVAKAAIEACGLKGE